MDLVSSKVAPESGRHVLQLVTTDAQLGVNVPVKVFAVAGESVTTTL